MPRTCQEVKMQNETAVDGEYFLSLDHNTFAKIYCHNMPTSPQEYIKLVAGTSSNYAANYHGNCSSIKRGISEFNMIRLSIEVFMKFIIIIQNMSHLLSLLKS